VIDFDIHTARFHGTGELIKMRQRILFNRRVHFSVQGRYTLRERVSQPVFLSMPLNYSPPRPQSRLTNLPINTIPKNADKKWKDAAVVAMGIIYQYYRVKSSYWSASEQVDSFFSGNFPTGVKWNCVPNLINPDDPKAIPF
jgi:hypothetical protein